MHSFPTFCWDCLVVFYLELNYCVNMALYCLICGRREDDEGVKKLFCFPQNIERLNRWKASLGIKHEEIMYGHNRVCDLHFNETDFIPQTPSLRLYKTAIPKPLNVSIIESNVCEAGPSTSVPLTSPNIQESDLYEAGPSSSFISSSPTMIDFNLSDALPTSPSAPMTPEKTDVLRTVTPTECLKPSTSSHQVLATPTSGVKGRRSLFKDIEGLCSGGLTPRKQKLMGIVKKKQGQIRKLQRLCKKRGKNIKDLQDIDKAIEMNNIFQGMAPTTAQFMISQIRCSRRSPHGRRWTVDDKIMSLAIFKRSPKCYSLLRRLFTLPSKRTLTLLLQSVPFSVGINAHIFQHLGMCLQKYDPKERLCTLAFDEMALKQHLQYVPSNDYIEGVEDYGNRVRTEKLARYALVFLAQGVTKNWKQPVAYYFTAGGVTSDHLQSIIHDVLEAMEEANIPVLGTVCDMGTANVKTLKNMGSDISSPYFFHKEKRVYTMFDPPHLLKCFRNLFKKHNILIEVLTFGGAMEKLQARWSDIIAAYEEDKRNILVFRSMYKIKDFYLNPGGQMSMKVKVAAQTLSRSVSVYIYNLIKQGILPTRALATANFINEIDELFDSFNGSSRVAPDGKPYRCIVTNESGHIKFWEAAFTRVNNWRFLRKPNDESNWKPPSQKGWLHNLKVFPLLWNHLKGAGLQSMRPRALNQDALENLFGCIRSGCGSNDNPSVSQFVSSLKTQIVNGLLNQDLKGTNCEADDFDLLSNLKSFIDCHGNVEQIAVSPKPGSSNEAIAIPVKSVCDITDLATAVAAGATSTMSVAYVTGFIAKRIFKKFNCAECKAGLSSDNLDPCNQFISLKEFCDAKNKLFYPTEQFVVAVGHGVTLLEEKLPKLRKSLKISEECSAFLNDEVDFSFISCETHSEFIKKSIIKSICFIAIPWYCTRVNREVRAEMGKKMSQQKAKKVLHL